MRFPTLAATVVIATLAAGCNDTTLPYPLRGDAVSYLRGAYGIGRPIVVERVGATHPLAITPESSYVLAYAWAPDGRHVAYSSGAQGVHVVSRDGSGNHVLQGTDTIPEPLFLAWSPDGQWLAASTIARLWIIPVAGGQARVVRPPAAATGIYSPAWAPDSRKLAYTTSEIGALGLITLDGPPIIFPEIAQAAHPDWSPDGTRIAYDDGYTIWIVNADGNSPRQIAPRCIPAGPCVNRWLDYPHWSPDGLHFAMHVQDADVGVMSVDGSDLRIVTTGLGYTTYTHPGWSRDGRVLFLADRQAAGLSAQRTYVMNADTSGITAVTTGYADVPRWVP